MKKKIYIAGKLNDMACDYITNVHKMIIWSECVRKEGFAVFVPGIDFLQGLVFGDWEYSDYFDNSQPWLAASDAIFVTPGWEESEGTKREMKLAKELNIPIFLSIKALTEYFNSEDRGCG